MTLASTRSSARVRCFVGLALHSHSAKLAQYASQAAGYSPTYGEVFHYGKLDDYDGDADYNSRGKGIMPDGKVTNACCWKSKDRALR